MSLMSGLINGILKWKSTVLQVHGIITCGLLDPKTSILFS